MANILKFQTKDGRKLIFDNSSGIVIRNGKYTEFFIFNPYINDEQLLKLVKENESDKELIEKEYSYINLLRAGGAFNELSFTDEGVNYNLFSGFSSHLILITTEDCNLRCKYCIYSDCYEDKKTYSSKRLNSDVAIKSVNIFLDFHKLKLEHGYEDLIKINFYGGEPLMNFKVIQDVVEYINSLNLNDVQYMLTTNGTVMNDKIIDFLAKNNFLVSFSLDGNESNHNRNRVGIKGKKTHQEIISNIRKYNEKRVEYGNTLPITITCCFDDYTDMDGVVRFFEELKRDILDLNVVYNKIYDIDTNYYDKYNTNKEKSIYNNSIINLFEKYYLLNKDDNGFVKIDRIPQSVKGIFNSYNIIKNRKKGVRNLYQGSACAIGDKLCVDPDGEIYICEKANQELSVGNIYNGVDLDKVKNVYDEFYKIRKEYCSNCSVVRLCDVCYIHFIKDNKIQFNKAFCSNRKESFRRAMSFIYTEIVNTPNIFD
ncbi:MAG: radical SAM protein [Filifactoraceae bacterium]